MLTRHSILLSGSSMWLRAFFPPLSPTKAGGRTRFCLQSEFLIAHKFISVFASSSAYSATRRRRLGHGATAGTTALGKGGVRRMEPKSQQRPRPTRRTAWFGWLHGDLNFDRKKSEKKQSQHLEYRLEDAEMGFLKRYFFDKPSCLRDA